MAARPRNSLVPSQKASTSRIKFDRNNKIPKDSKRTKEKNNIMDLDRDSDNDSLHHSHQGIVGNSDLETDTATHTETERNSKMDLDLDDQAEDGLDWGRLPRELLTNIFSYLSFNEIEAVEDTCVSWRNCCNAPSLWRRIEFNFDGSDSLRLVSTAFRILASKGHLVRDMAIRIGNPGINQAWLMSECVQQLLDCISHSSSCCLIESFTISNLIIFTQNRFFKLSKESILNSVNNFLRSQNNLRSVSFASCKFNPGEGLKILRTLKSSAFRDSLEKLELRDFFKRRYVSAVRALKVITCFPALQEVSVDASYMDDDMLRWMAEGNQQHPHRKPLRKVKVYFEALKPPPASVSRQGWLSVGQFCPHGLQVSYHFSGWLLHEWVKPFFLDAVPLVDVVICWDKLHRWPKNYYSDLALLLQCLATHNAPTLERFTLSTCIRSSPALEDALIRLVTSCRRLSEVTVVMKLTCQAVTAISAVLSERSFPVQWSLQPTTSPSAGCTPSTPRVRYRGC